ncbi:MAG: hypothetical protein JW841_09420 [Deltaproteobacteria bacterium]|nr:hypothetical protein [Deltaproteobacteria bacterium]
MMLIKALQVKRSMSNLVSASNTATTLRNRRNIRVLEPSSIALCLGPSLIEAIVTTSVLVLIWDWRCGVGGAVHYEIPFCDSDILSLRSGLPAIPTLLQWLAAQNTNALNLQAKIYGGMETSDQGRLGESNASLAFRMLSETNIPVLSSIIGGLDPRHVAIELPSGQAWVRDL